MEAEIIAFAKSVKEQVRKLTPEIYSKLKHDISILLHEAKLDNFKIEDSRVTSNSAFVDDTVNDFSSEEWKVEFLDEDHDIISNHNLLSLQAHSPRNCSDAENSFPKPSTTPKFCVDTPVEQPQNRSKRKKKRPPPKKQLYICHVCGIALKQRTSVKRHMMIHKGEMPFSCPVCPHRSRLLSSMQRHVRQHTGEKPFKCRLCPLTFRSSSNRLKHTLRHENIKPYKCSKCDKAYVEKSCMLDHEAFIHSGYKRHSCNMCLERFRNDEGLRKHLFREHKIVRPKELQRRAFRSLYMTGPSASAPD